MHAYAVTCHCQHCITLTDSFQFGSKKKETTDRATEEKKHLTTGECYQLLSLTENR